jgi:hypothetical protein
MDRSARADRDARRSSVGEGAPARRTVTISGRGTDRQSGAWQSSARRRPPRRARERAGTRPDRIAMWAVLLGVLLVLAAATSSHAAVYFKPHAPLHASVVQRSLQP